MAQSPADSGEPLSTNLGSAELPGLSAQPADAQAESAQIGSRVGFEELKHRAYLAHAAISPPASWVQNAVKSFISQLAVNGADFFPVWQSKREQLRERLGELIHASADEIALLPNTSRGISDIAQNIPWRPSDRVLLFDGEFPTNITPWQQASKYHQLELRWLNADEFRAQPEAALTKVAYELQSGVRLLALSAVQFQTGLRMPIEQIGALCKRYGCEFFVDGIQACGVTPIDVKLCHIDYLASGGHKWLMGLEGTGFLYISSEKLKQLEHRHAGWLSHEQGLDFLFEGVGHLRYDRPFKAEASRFETGMVNAIGFAALSASLGALMSLGVPAIQAHIAEYLRQLEGGLEHLGWESMRTQFPEGYSGILSYRMAGKTAPQIQAALAEQGICCSAPDGHLRFAPHFWNSLDEVPEVVRAIERAAR